MTTKWEGLLSPSHGRWFSSSDGIPEGTPTHLGARSTMFIRVWKAYLKAHGIKVPCSVQRPWSYAWSYWTQCYRLPWPKKRLEMLDRAILGLQSRQIARPQELQKFFVSQFVLDEWH